ncbi:adenylosuccinate synthetase [Patescibacteria group bacterium]|nr:adenylosuccinate synthetase [Patescibacteria group bacterium]
MFASIVTDLGFGDAGKGTTVDFLARQINGATVVRFNGGAQAAHNVHTTDGRHHTFSQFGSGTLVPGTRTYLSRFVLFDPYALMREAEGLMRLGVGSPLSLVTVDEAALTVTPFQKAANRLREALRGDGRHGSVGMGIGETMADMLAFPEQAVYAVDLRDVAVLTQKLHKQQALKYAEFAPYFAVLSHNNLLRDELRVITDPAMPRLIAQTMVTLMRSCTLGTMATLRRLSATSPLIFEGAQGILIDEWHGFHPYTTWSTTTNDNANTLLRELMYQGSVTRYGVVRAYSTRHGPGPFPSESSALTTALPDSHNHFGVWQREFRVGWLDLPLTRYALTVSAGTDAVVLTHLDRWATLPEKKVVTHYRLGEGELSLRARLAVVLDETVREPGFVFIKSFKPKTDLEDLTYQELLGEIVTKATPVYQSVSHTGEAYAEFVGMMLDLPVTITSYGKTAADKRSTKRLHMVA